MKRKFFQRLGRVATALTLALSLVVPTNIGTLTVHAASDVTVNLASKKQMIQGVGGINHPVWTSDLTATQRETAFGNGANQLGFTILRIHVDENKNNWSKELATAKAAAKNGALIFASPWNPPASMCEKFTRNGKPNQQRLKYSSYGAYAQHLNDFVSYMKQNGVELYAISVQNEPDYADTWTWWTPQEMLNFMKNYAGKINCRVIAPESFQYLKNMSDPILNDPTALANMDILGTHFYGTQTKNMSYPLFKQKGAGKELWMTEVYVPDSSSSADAWPNALEVAVNMNDAFAVGDMQAYVWWYIRRSYGPMKEDGTISKRGYCMAQYSKFIRRGYYRVDATMNPNTKVYVSAYTGDGKAVIVATNNSDTTYTQRFNVSNGSIKKVDRYRTSASENLAKTSNLEITNNGFYASLPARSVSTFVCDLGTGSTVNPTPTPTPQPQPQPSQPTTGEVAKINDGWYYIKGVASQKYLQVNGNTGKNVQNVEIGTGTGADGQIWKVTNTGNGYFTLTSRLGNFGLDIGNGSADNGANVQIYQLHGGEAQQFVAKTTSQSGAYAIATRCTNGSKVLDVEQKKTTDGANVCQYTYNGQTNQMWIFEPVKVSEQQQPTNPQPSNPQPQPTQPTTGSLSVNYTINNWGSGYQVSFKVENKSGAKVNTWTVTVPKSQIKIDASWNVNVKESGSNYVITPVSWNATIENGNSVEFGVQGSGSIGSSISCTVK